MNTDEGRVVSGVGAQACCARLAAKILGRSKTAPLLLLAAGFLACNAHAATLDEAMADPQLWPAEVAVLAMTKAGVVKNGQVSGMMLIGAGKKLTVSGLAADGITGKVGGTTVKVAIDKTDLLQRLGEPGGTTAPAAAAPAAPVHAAAAPAPPNRNAAFEAAMANEPPSAIQQALLGRLVRLENGRLKPFDMRKLNGVKYYGIMFSAGWCGPCRAFAPHLLENYRNLRAQFPEFELVLVSNDRSEDDMLAYMREENMPWPALKYSELGAAEEITRFGGPGIPDLVLIDASGKELANSFKGGDYLGPGVVLDAAWRVLGKTHPAPHRASNQ